MATQASNPLPVPQVPIKDADKPLFESINAFVYTYMSNYDNSHDYQHILRVLSNTNRIFQAELATNPSATYDITALFLAALLHDVGDHKYAKQGENIKTLVLDNLLAHGADYKLAQKIQCIVDHVSYTHEIRNPEAVTKMMKLVPEIAIVQDADRLDAIGAVGIARCFSFGAAKMPDQPMDRAVGHFEDKLYRLAGMMKTEAGKEMAKKRHDVLQEFARQWGEETELSFEVV